MKPLPTALSVFVLSLAWAHGQVPLCTDQGVAGGPHLPAGHGLGAGQIPDCRKAGNTTTFTLKAPTVIHWDRFSVGPGETIRYEFPGVQNRVVLNRDLSGGRTRIEGNIFAQGRFILIKPNGSLQVRPGATIEADEGVLLSTLEVSDQQTLLDGGTVEFTGDGSSFIDNEGTIRANGGDVVLVSGSINNKIGGRLLAPAGSVRLGAGTRIRLADTNEPRIGVLEGGANTISNSGLIEARDVVEATAFAANAVPDGQRDPVILNSGIIRVTGANGRVFLQAPPGGGQILNDPNGVIEAPQPIAIEGTLVSEGTLIIPDDGGNPGSASGSRQFPRLSSGGLVTAPNANFQLSRLSVNLLNGIAQDGNTTSSDASRKPTSITVRGSGSANGQASPKKPASTNGKKIILRRGAFFGKKTSG